MMKKLVRIFTVIGTIALLYIGYENIFFTRITIIHTNDIHGHVLSKFDKKSRDYIGGAAAINAIITREKKRLTLFQREFVVIDAGDWFSGTPEGNLTNGNIMIDFFNTVGYNFLTVGNHEFDAGYDNLLRLINKSKALIVGSNIRLPGTYRYVIRNYEGVRVAFIGLLTDEIREISIKKNLGSAQFIKTETALTGLKKVLSNQKIDIVIAITHQGVRSDKETLKEFKFINLIVGGHSHTALFKPYFIGNRAMVQAGSYSKYVGVVTLKISRITDKIVDISGHLIPVLRKVRVKNSFISRIIERYEKKISKTMDIKIGTAKEKLRRNAFEESPLGDLADDILRKVTGADIAFQNSFGIRSAIDAGPITLRDIYNVHPFGNTIITMELSGRQIKKILEQSATMKKGLIQLSGLNVVIDMSRPIYHRVVSVSTADGKRLNDEKYYKVATNNFLAQGGDFYKTFTKGRNVKNTYLLVRDAVANYIKNGGALSYKTDGRIIVNNYDRSAKSF